MIRFTERSDGGHYQVTMPEPEHLPEPTASAVRAVADARALLVAKRRERDAAQTAVRDARARIETEAAAAVLESGKVPKGLRKAAKAAEEQLADVELEVRAATAAFHTRYGALVATLTTESDSLRAHALKAAESALTRLAAARRAFDVAAADAAAAYGVLGLVAENAREGIVRPVVREPLKSRRAFAMSAATQALGVAVGESNLDLVAHQAPRPAATPDAGPVDDPGRLAAEIAARRAAAKSARAKAADDE